MRRVRADNEARPRTSAVERFTVERAQHDVLHDRAALADRRERPHQRVRRVDLVVPVRADEEQVLRLGLDQDVLQQIERRPIEPLQIVEEQRQRMLGACEHTDQPAKGHLKAGLRVRRRDVWNRRLLADHELQLGNQVEEQRGVRAERVTQLLPPLGELGFGLARAADGSGFGRPGPAWRTEHRASADRTCPTANKPRGGTSALCSSPTTDGLADAGVAADEHQLRRAARDGGVERGEQGLDLALAPV